MYTSELSKTDKLFLIVGIAVSLNLAILTKKQHIGKTPTNIK